PQVKGQKKSESKNTHAHIHTHTHTHTHMHTYTHAHTHTHSTCMFSDCGASINTVGLLMRHSAPVKTVLMMDINLCIIFLCVCVRALSCLQCAEGSGRLNGLSR